MESILTVFCCVVFPFHDSISSCLHVHGNVPKCYPRILWVVFISLLCMKNKIHIGLKGDKGSNNSIQTIETRITALLAFVFKENKRSCLKCGCL